MNIIFVDANMQMLFSAGDEPPAVDSVVAFYGAMHGPGSDSEIRSGREFKVLAHEHHYTDAAVQSMRHTVYVIVRPLGKGKKR